MTKIKAVVNIAMSGSELADWWWELDSGEQADFFARLESIKDRDPVAFLMQLEFLREAMQRLFASQGEHQCLTMNYKSRYSL